ncbi:MAG TPA: nitrite/sulfite reductase [Candidatus Acidoferrum sp.]|jgi:sulfite reductase beta subunit-like hemoprotein|nr:nitrite/sulfite reductase [Candidatus Acidoferrum sp.]
MTVAVTTEVEERHSREAIEGEIARFEDRARQLRRGEITEEQFRPFRLKHGTYGQRQAGFQMLRVKVAAGVLKAAQLRVLAEIADEYSTGRGHLTTRENVQFHFVKLENVPAAMRLLADSGLTTREACGNTVRNVTSCPVAGICPGEAFDVTPYALGVSRYLLRHPDFHDLPRKFKIAFSGCEDDGACAVAGIHDVGLIAQVRGSNGTAHRGFKVLVGGGLGSLPTEAAVLSDFLPEEELLPTIEAVLRVFSETGNRKNKLKARLKFVLRDKGIEELRRLVFEKRETSQAPAEVFTVPSPIRPALVTIATAPLNSSASNNSASDPEYDRWAEHNLMSQRQAGYGAIWIKLAAGTFHSQQMRGLADVIERNELSGVRIAVNQDMVIPWVPFDRARVIYDELRALDLAIPGARTISDVTGCPGATTCNLGITRSLTLADELSRALDDYSDPEIQKLRIKISGCPNSCGHHHIADIGFYGNVRKIGDQQAPYYQLMLGGKVNADGVRFGRQILSVPARPIPAIIRELLAFYQQDRQPGESFSAWVARTPDKSIVERLRPLVEVTNATEDIFLDWGDTETYSLKLGRGECVV